MSEPRVASDRDFDGLNNFRDLGGLVAVDGRRVRAGRLYRSDALHRMSEADAAQLRDLGIVTVIDLRSPDEIERIGTGHVGAVGATYHNLPTLTVLLTADADDDEPLPEPAERYMQYLTEDSPCFGRVLDVLVDPNGTPAVFHCNAGKDRTGVVAAMVLSLLGIPDDAIAADYALTQDALPAIMAATRGEYPPDVKIFRRLTPDKVHARAETMFEFLSLVRERLGGWPVYLATLGVADATLDALRDTLLEDG